MTDPGGNEHFYEYDKGGALKKVWLGSQEYVKDIRYDAKGQRQRIVYGNNTVTRYTYDPLTYRLRSLLTTANTGTVKRQELFYTYDPVGNITQIEDGVQPAIYYNNTVVQALQTFTYDALYRLIQATGRELDTGGSPAFAGEDNWNDAPAAAPPGSNASRNYTQSYTYDAVGNILSLQHSAGAGSYTRQFSYAYGHNRLVSTSVTAGTTHNFTNFPHDVRGNMTTMPHLDELWWNALNELHALERGSLQAYYQYSGGQRVRKWVDKGSVKEERVYLGGFEIYRKFNGSSLKIVERTTIHIQDDTGRIAMLESRTYGTASDDNNTAADLVRYIYSNHLQSASLELDENAEIISYEEYHPYGTSAYQAKSATINAVAKRYRYTGKERDEESGLYYHGARYYIPWLCRWCAVEPLEAKYAGKSPYQYCDDNPVINIDPDGKDKITFHYFSSAHHILPPKSSLLSPVDGNREIGMGNIPQPVSNSYMWATIETADGPNTYQIEKITVDSYDDQAPIMTTTLMPVTHPEYNFDYRPEFYKAVHDFSATLSNYYKPEISSSSSAQHGRNAANEVYDLLKRERDYTHAKKVEEGANAIVLGVLEFAAAELVLARLLKGAGFVSKVVEGGGSSNGVTLAHEGFGVEKASSELIETVSKKRDVLIAVEGTDEFAYMNGRIEGVAQGAKNDQILLMPNPSKITVLEEFLHGTQNRIGVLKAEGSVQNINFAEWHVKDFMIRHQKMLGIGAEDVNILTKEREVYSNWLSNH